MLIEKPYITPVANKLLFELNTAEEIHNYLMKTLDNESFNTFVNWCEKYFVFVFDNYNVELKFDRNPYSYFYYFINSNNLWGKTIEEVVILWKLTHG